MASEKDFREARSHWNLHCRPLLRIDTIASSLLILVIFAIGFLKRAKPEDLAKHNEPPAPSA